jgi:hypothetical protein
MVTEAARILIAAEAGSDADLVRRLLLGAFPKVGVSTDPAALAADFDLHRPQVLVLACRDATAAPDGACGAADAAVDRHVQAQTRQPAASRARTGRAREGAHAVAARGGRRCVDARAARALVWRGALRDREILLRKVARYLAQ